MFVVTVFKRTCSIRLFMFNWFSEQENNVLFILISLLLLFFLFLFFSLIYLFSKTFMCFQCHHSCHGYQLPHLSNTWKLFITVCDIHDSFFFLFFHTSPIRWQDLWVWLKNRTLKTKGRIFWMTSDSFLCSSSLMSSIFHIFLLWSTT